MKNLHRNGWTVLELVVVLAAVGLLLAIAIPGINKLRNSKARETCQTNLADLLAMKNRWAAVMTNSIPPVDISEIEPGMVDLYDVFGNIRPPVCPKGGRYTVGKIGEIPSCSMVHYYHTYIAPGQTTN